MKYIYIILVLICFSCSEREVESVQIKGFDEPILANGENMEVLFFDIIMLEFNSESAISIIKRVEILDSTIIVQTDSKLLAFNMKGDFSHSFSRKGRANNEYVNLSCFVIGKDNNISIVDESSKKIITFDVSGKFLDIEQFETNVLPAWVSEGVYIDKSRILFANMVYNDINTIYSTFNVKTKEEESLYRLPVKTQGVAQSIGRPIAQFHDNISLLIPFDNNIYKLNNKTLVKAFTIETKQPILDRSEIKSINNFGIEAYSQLMSNNYFIGFTGIFETNEFIVVNQFNLKYFIIDKSNYSGQLYDYSIEDNAEFLPLIDLQTSYQDMLVGVADPMRLLSLKHKISNDSKNVNIDKLRNAINSTSINSNPCILLYKIKIQNP